MHAASRAGNGHTDHRESVHARQDDSETSERTDAGRRRRIVACKNMAGRDAEM